MGKNSRRIANEKQEEIRPVLQGRYYLEKKLGHGGMGEVFLAFDAQEGNVPRAIKRMSRKDKKARYRFEREYNLLNRITHSNLVKAYDFFAKDNDLYMVMEYVDGQTMGSILRQGDRVFSLPEQLAIAIKVARGLEVIHSAGMIHRDIKPDNIMISFKSGSVKLIDMGLGREFNHSSRVTVEGEVLGTACYMSPEQANGEKLTEDSDIFSLGVTLYQFFLWQKNSPFEAGTLYKTCLNVCTCNPPNLYDEICKKLEEIGAIPSQKGKIVYEKLSELVSKAISKEGENRIQAVEMAEEMEKIYDRFMGMESCRNPISNQMLYGMPQKICPQLTQTLSEIRMEQKLDITEDMEEAEESSYEQIMDIESYRNSVKSCPELCPPLAPTLPDILLEEDLNVQKMEIFLCKVGIPIMLLILFGVLILLYNITIK